MKEIRFNQKEYKKEGKYPLSMIERAYHFGMLNYKENIIDNLEEDYRVLERLGIKKEIKEIPNHKTFLNSSYERDENRVKGIIKLEKSINKACREMNVHYSIIHVMVRSDSRNDRGVSYRELVRKIRRNITNNNLFKEKWMGHGYTIERGKRYEKDHLHLMILLNLNIDEWEIEDKRREIGKIMLEVGDWIYLMVGDGNKTRGMGICHVSYSRMRYPEKCEIWNSDIIDRINAIDYMCYITKKENKKRGNGKEFGIWINSRYRETKKKNEEADMALREMKEKEDININRIKSVYKLLKDMKEYCRATGESLYFYKTTVTISKMSLDEIREGLKQYNQCRIKSIVIDHAGYVYHIRKTKGGYVLEIFNYVVNVGKNKIGVMNTIDNQWWKILSRDDRFGVYDYVTVENEYLYDVDLSTTDEVLLNTMEGAMVIDPDTAMYQRGLRAKMKNSRMFGAVWKKRRRGVSPLQENHE